MQSHPGLVAQALLQIRCMYYQFLQKEILLYSEIINGTYTCGLIITRTYMARITFTRAITQNHYCRLTQETAGMQIAIPVPQTISSAAQIIIILKTTSCSARNVRASH